MIRRRRPPRRVALRSLFLAALIPVFFFTPVAEAARANGASAAERDIGECIRRASRGRPWLEETLWALRDQEGGWIGAEIVNANGTQDLGPLQVNSWWVPRIAALTNSRPSAVQFWLRFDPCFNAETARWIFLSALAVSHDYWKAVGTYHSPDAWRQRRYARSIATKLQGRFGSHVFVRGASTDAAHRKPSRTQLPR